MVYQNQKTSYKDHELTNQVSETSFLAFSICQKFNAGNLVKNFRSRFFNTNKKLSFATLVKRSRLVIMDLVNESIFKPHFEIFGKSDFWTKDQRKLIFNRVLFSSMNPFFILMEEIKTVFTEKDDLLNFYYFRCMIFGATRTSKKPFQCKAHIQVLSFQWSPSWKESVSWLRRIVSLNISIYQN